MSISTVTSEALQLKLRQLLPSQQGFGTDLSASDTIIPIIDLTAAAEGSDVPQNLQTALAFGSQTAFTATTSGVTIANTPGFYRVVGTINVYTGAAGQLSLTDGSTTKIVYQYQGEPGVATFDGVAFDQVYFLNAGESLIVKITTTTARLLGSIRQIADVNGTLVQPVGFAPQ